MDDEKPVISDRKMPKLLKTRTTRIPDVASIANGAANDDSCVIGNVSETLPESGVSSACLRRSGRTHRGKSALELLGITTKDIKNFGKDAKQVTGKYSAIIQDQQFLRSSAECADGRYRRSVAKQRSSSGSIHGDGLSQGDQRISESDRGVELLKEQRTEEVFFQEGRQGRHNENDQRSQGYQSDNKKHRDESITERSKVEGPGPSRTQDCQLAATSASAKASTLTESFRGILSTASRKVITISRRIETSSKNEVAASLIEPLTKVSCHCSADFPQGVRKTDLTGSSPDRKAFSEADCTAKFEVAKVPCCKSAEFNQVYRRELTGGLPDGEATSTTNSRKLSLESQTVEPVEHPHHEFQQQRKESDVVTRSDRMKSPVTCAVRKIAPNRKRHSRKDDRFEPCTSDDLNNLLRNEKGRALPVHQLVMGHELQDLIENLEPQDHLENHVIASKKSGKRLVMHCKYCSKAIHNQHEFRRHIKTHAEADYNPFRCPYCDYRAQIRAQIARHINIHSAKKAYVCKECGRGFNFKQKLQIHMKYHEDVRDHACPLCQLSFHEFKTLKNHLIKIHQVDNVNEIIPRKRKPPKRLLATKEAPPSDEASESGGHVTAENKASDNKASNDETLVVCDENTNQVIVIDGVEYRAGTYVAVDNGPSTFDPSKGHPESGVRLIEFLRSLEVKKEVGSETDLNSSGAVNPSGAFNPSDAVHVLFEGNKSVVLRVADAQELLEDGNKDEKSESASGKKARVRRRGIIGTRKTILQTKKFRMALEGATELNSPPQKVKATERDRTRVQLVGGPSKRFVNNQRIVAASDVSSELKEFCDVFNDHPDFPDFKVIFICKVCGPERPAFPSKTQFATHLEMSHPDIKAWTCQFCSYRCRLRTSLIVHSKMHSTHGSHICELCGEAFVFKQKLMSHIRQHMNKRDFVCDICSKAFNEPSHLRKHVKTVHCDERPCKCEICGKRFKKAMNLRRHMEVHTSTQRFQCEYCIKLYKTQTSLMQHVKSHKCIFHCEICSRNFGSYSGFMAHKVMHDESLTGYSCYLCHKVLHTKGSLQRHRTMVHTNVRAFKCELCQKSFKSKKDLQMHKFVHTSEKNFVCSLCGFECKRATSLSVHLRRHYAVKPFQCSVCNKQYTQKQSLETHLGKHCSVDDFDCRLCGKTCSGSMGLKRHLQLGHSGKRISDLDLDPSTESSFVNLGFMYSCEDCSSVFTTQEDLAGHILSEHMKPTSQSEIRMTCDLEETPAAVHFEVNTDTETIQSAAGANQKQPVGKIERSDTIHSLVMIEDPSSATDRIISVLIPNDGVTVARNLILADSDARREMKFSAMENSVPATEDVYVGSDSRASSILCTGETVMCDTP